ncbi:MAG: hypothetical protein EXS38_08415 [Opitutus sp.]|nr:hypothetical protein [Opitutus sp.]
MDITIYKLSPTTGNKEEIKAGLDVVDREIKRLEDRANAQKVAPAREAAKERLVGMRTQRLDIGPNYTKARWDKLLFSIFQATEIDRLAATKLDDAALWNLSRNQAFTEAGHATVALNCGPCHLPSLRDQGESAEAFGPDLTDTAWIHVGRPTEVYAFITTGAFDRGMPPWGSLVGPKKVIPVAAFVLSKHKEGEPILVQGELAPITNVTTSK